MIFLASQGFAPFVSLGWLLTAGAVAAGCIAFAWLIVDKLWPDGDKP